MKKVLIILLFILPIAVSGQRMASSQRMRSPEIQLQKLSQFYNYLASSYLDTVNYSKLVETAIKDMLSELDPHSTYVSSEEMRGVEESFEGNFGGIGIEFNVVNDTIIVINTIANGPSQKVGLLPNDKIVTINGESSVGLSRTQVPKLLRGPKGTEVNIEVVRRGVAEPLAFRIIRDDIPISTIDAAYNIDPHTGYIRINRFANNTTTEFVDEIEKMGDIDALILDLRGNGGGLMNEALTMSNFFLPQGALIMSSEGLRVPEERYTARTTGPFTKGKVIVLVDEFSASASEIVAGALQDWDRAVIIGRRSFGKGTVQRQYPLVDGSAVRITVARYHTPTGRAIQRPFEQGNSEAYYQEYVDRVNSGTDSLVIDETQQYKTLRLGKTVYGGGGIYPDIYVPQDTSGYSVYWANLVRHGVDNEFSILYLDRNRAALERQYADFEAFAREFIVTDQLLDELAALGESKGIPRDYEGITESRGKIEIRLKALIAQKLYGMREYYRIINENDDDFRKALEVLRNWRSMASGIATESI